MRYIVFDLETQTPVEGDILGMEISVACVYDSGTDEYTVVDITELQKLWPVIEQAEVLVGYNSNHFDIPLLNKYYPGDLTHIKSIDLLEDIRLSLGRRLRLDDVAQATIGAKKSAHGLQAIKWWREGDIASIKKYCKQDVKITKELFEYALEHKKVMYKDGRTKRDIPLDTSHWLPHDELAMTHSLPF